MDKILAIAPAPEGMYVVTFEDGRHYVQRVLYFGVTNEDIVPVVLNAERGTCISVNPSGDGDPQVKALIWDGPAELMKLYDMRPIYTWETLSLEVRRDLPVDHPYYVA